MPLKLKKSQTLSEPISRKDEMEGPWGRINPEPQSVVALRLCKRISHSKEETHSYPYRVLSSWRWSSGTPDEEELKIEAGTDLITVRGRGLDRIVDALDAGSLEILRESPSDGRSETSLWISLLQISREPA
jgi:hypothetical protein